VGRVKVLWYDGSFPIRLLCDQDTRAHSFKFWLERPGFFRVFEGEW
jgi:hypothetical protein